MSAPEDRLDEDTHGRILSEKIIPESRVIDLTSHGAPKAIILAGQPGAGKGGLVKIARRELDDDILVIDPDALRDAHPKIKEFQSAHPYTWSGDTHPDASEWAKQYLQTQYCSSC